MTAADAQSARGCAAAVSGNRQRARRTGDRTLDRRLKNARTAMPVTTLSVVLTVLLQPASLYGQVIALREALDAAASSNRAIRSAEIQREKAIEDVRIARTHRLPVFSITTFVSQPLTQIGVTLDRGILGVYPGVGPIPGRTTTLESPLQLGFIFYG